MLSKVETSTHGLSVSSVATCVSRPATTTSDRHVDVSCRLNLHLLIYGVRAISISSVCQVCLRFPTHTSAKTMWTTSLSDVSGYDASIFLKYYRKASSCLRHLQAKARNDARFSPAEKCRRCYGKRCFGLQNNVVTNLFLSLPEFLQKTRFYVSSL